MLSFRRGQCPAVYTDYLVLNSEEEYELSKHHSEHIVYLALCLSSQQTGRAYVLCASC